MAGAAERRPGNYHPIEIEIVKRVMGKNSMLLIDPRVRSVVNAFNSPLSTSNTPKSSEEWIHTASFPKRPDFDALRACSAAFRTRYPKDGEAGISILELSEYLESHETIHFTVRMLRQNERDPPVLAKWTAPIVADNEIACWKDEKMKEIPEGKIGDEEYNLYAALFAGTQRVGVDDATA